MDSLVFLTYATRHNNFEERLEINSALSETALDLTFAIAFHEEGMHDLSTTFRAHTIRVTTLKMQVNALWLREVR